nr:hypothetical protein [Tanacetum cinerariifolium]
MHNDVDDLIESALNSKLLLINLKSQRLDKENIEVKDIIEQSTKCRTRITESLQNFRVIHKMSSISNTSQISSVIAIAPDLPTEEPEYSLSMGESISPKIDPHYFNAESNLLESLLNRDTLIDSSPKFDNLLEEFSDSEGDIHILEELLSNDTPPLLENDSSNFDHHDDPSFSRPPSKPPDVEIFFDFKPDTGVLTTKVVKGTSEHYVLIPNILPTLPTLDHLYPVFDTLLPFSFENEDKVFKPGILSYLLVSHQDKITFDFFSTQ